MGMGARMSDSDVRFWEALAQFELKIVELLNKLGKLAELIPDEKKEARERSKDDLNRKRKDLMKRRGK